MVDGDGSGEGTRPSDGERSVSESPQPPDDEVAREGTHPSAAEPLTYAGAGVDLDAADRSIELLSDVLGRATRPEVLGSIGGFGGLFALDLEGYQRPVLVSSTDGVGTKVDLARELGILDTVGRDLVAMVVDDLVVTGAEPLFFNDYVSVGKLEPERVAALVRGVAEGCAEAGCALVGGETAEHPGLLGPEEFDLAGFGVGIVEQDRILGPDRVREGDVLVAMAASGLHSNGYSLVRRIIEGRDLAEDPGFGRPLGEELLEPTRIYALDCLALDAEVEVHARCHITGGGLPGNLPRILPTGLAARVDATSWTWPPVFRWLAESGPVTNDEMWATFNCGVGMVAVVAADVVDEAIRLLEGRGVSAWQLGEVVTTDELGAPPLEQGSAVDPASDGRPRVVIEP